MEISLQRPAAHKVSGTRSWFLVPLIVGALAFVAILTVPRLLTHRTDSQTAPIVVSEKRSGQECVSKPAESVDSSKPKMKPEPEQAISQTANPPTACNAADAASHSSTTRARRFEADQR